VSAGEKLSQWWRGAKRRLLAVDAFIDSSMYEGGRFSLATLKTIAAFSDGLHVSGVRKALIDFACEGLNLGIVLLLAVLTLAQPAFRLTSDQDWLKRQDLAVTFLDRYGVEVGQRGIKHDDAVRSTNCLISSSRPCWRPRTVASSTISASMSSARCAR